jgi:hypothetical protein
MCSPGNVQATPSRCFCAMRQMMGGNFHGDAYNVITSFESIIKTGIAYCSVDGNTVLARETTKAYNLLREQKMNKKRSRLILDFLPSSYLLVLDELLLPPSMLLFYYYDEKKNLR